jgi:hypothetical protein
MLKVLVKIHIHSYCETDVFTICAFGFTPEDVEADPEYAHAAPDFDDFKVPGILLPALIGEYGEPDELVGRVFTIELPA